jgi:hypothetical protein
MVAMRQLLRFAFLSALLVLVPGALANDFPTTFSKSDPFSVAFYKSGTDVYLDAGTLIGWSTYDCDFPSATAVTLPTMVGGTDYEIRVKTDCSLYARDYAATPIAGSKALGGFHFLPGSYPNDHNLGGTSMPTLLEWSFWDRNFRPSCPDPRGMTKIGNAPFWVDIYFAGDSYATDGVSRNNQPILTGTNPPERADDYGGYGTSKYGTLNWWEANEVVNQWGKRLPSYGEMTLAAFGASEGKGRGNHPIYTGLNTFNTSTMWWDRYFTSKFGLIQAVGSIWIWTSDLSDWEGTAATGPFGWDAYNVTGGRGSIIMQNSDDLTALLFGGKWGYQDANGTRMTETIEKLWDSSANLGLRGAADHFFQF